MATITSRGHRAGALLAALSAVGVVLAACAGTTSASAGSLATSQTSSRAVAAAAAIVQAPVATDHGHDGAVGMDMSSGQAVIAGSGAAASREVHGDHAAVSAQIELYTAMRSLWDEHMQWTYDTVVAYATNPDGLTPTLNRLLANQVHLGDAVKPFYGDAAGDALTALLQTHITDAVPVLDAARAGDQVALATAIDVWNANAVEIGDFLSAANPRAWPKDAMRNMMTSHISQTVAYASDILTGDWGKAITDYDIAHAHMQDMSDMLASGIIAQFPKKF